MLRIATSLTAGGGLQRGSCFVPDTENRLSDSEHSLKQPMIEMPILQNQMVSDMLKDWHADC